MFYWLYCLSILLSKLYLCLWLHRLRPWQNQPTTELSEMRGAALPLWNSVWRSHETLQRSEANQHELSPETQIESIFCLRDRSMTSWRRHFCRKSYYTSWAIGPSQIVLQVLSTFHCAQSPSLCRCVVFSSMLRPAEEVSLCRVDALLRTIQNHQWRASCKCWMMLNA